ncbi:hypothetical protein AAHH78_34905, partial [Burkholderia pseudomallei]
GVDRVRIMVGVGIFGGLVGIDAMDIVELGGLALVDQARRVGVDLVVRRWTGWILLSVNEGGGRPELVSLRLAQEVCAI